MNYISVLRVFWHDTISHIFFCIVPWNKIFDPLVTISRILIQASFSSKPSDIKQHPYRWRPEQQRHLWQNWKRKRKYWVVTKEIFSPHFFCKLLFPLFCLAQAKNMGNVPRSKCASHVCTNRKNVETSSRKKNLVNSFRKQFALKKANRVGSILEESLNQVLWHSKN